MPALRLWRRQKRCAWRSHVVLVLLVQMLLVASSLADEIEVLSYNIYMRPFFQDGQKIRADFLLRQLSGYDTIVFQEAFDDEIRGLFLAGLGTEYPFSTHILGEDAGIGQDGGVIILSKWPIVREGQRVFTKGKPSMHWCPGPGCCQGLDCYAEKGVVYALINKAGRCYHLFGTHVQSGTENWELRNEQFRVIKHFITSHHIPSDEPVIIAGDMNVNRYDEAWFAEMRALLRAEQPRLRPTVSSTPGMIYTFDSPRNDLNDNENTQRYVDYVLYSVDHLSPIRAFNQVRIIRAPEPWRQYFWQNWHLDLSDHYAVLGRFDFDYAQNSNLSCPSSVSFFR
jgi:endonuclease/exonuclease/phosphatase family metal-dependent hydrolase